jgi:hypothetical protein
MHLPFYERQKDMNRLKELIQKPAETTENNYDNNLDDFANQVVGIGPPKPYD